MDCSFIGWCLIPLEAQAAWAQAILSAVGIGWAAVSAHRDRVAAANLQKDLLRPHVTMAFDRRAERPEIRVRFISDGLGPAIIRQVEWSIDGERVHSPGIDGIKFIMGRLQSEGAWAGKDFIEQYRSEVFQEDEWIRPGVEHLLLGIYLGEDARIVFVKDPIGALEETLSRVKVTVHYESVFRERFTAHGLLGVVKDSNA